MVEANLNGNQGGAAVADGVDDLGAAMRAAADLTGDPGAGADDQNQNDAGAQAQVKDGEEAQVQAQDQEPEYVKSLRSELAEIKQWKEEQTRTYAEEQERAKAEQNKPREMTDQEWGDVEKRWGLIDAVNKETGEKEINIIPRRLIDTVIKTIQYGLNQQKDWFDKALHERTNSYQLDSVFSELEKRPNAPVSDVRQYSTAIREYLGKRYHPKDHSNPEYVLDAYYWSKGRGMKDAQKRIENNMEQKKRVIHPAGGGSAGQGKQTGGKEFSGDASAQAFLSRFDT